MKIEYIRNGDYYRAFFAANVLMYLYSVDSRSPL